VPDGRDPALLVKQYEHITLRELYDGIDLHCYSTNGLLETDWLVAPGVDYKQIRMEIKGADLTVDDQGHLIMHTPLGEIQEGRLKVYQDDELVAASWVVTPLSGNEKGGLVSFDIPNYNPLRKLRIDPAVVVRQWATYYGGSANERIFSCIADNNGNAYMAGISSSTASIASGGHQNTYGGGNYDAFLVKFDSEGVRQWATYYGGSDEDWGRSCTTDELGNVYLVGSTKSTSDIAFGGHQNTHNGGEYDAMLVKFNNDGLRQWATYFGGDQYESGNSCVADGNGHLYFLSNSGSNSDIASVGFETTRKGDMDAVLSKFDSNGTRVWSRYYGGNATDEGLSCALDSSGNVFIAGLTNSSSGLASSEYVGTYTGLGQESFIAKFDNDGQHLWGKYFQGYGDQYIQNCATDGSGAVYLSGLCDIANVYNGHQSVYGGGAWDAMLVKLNSAGQHLWSTYYGGAGDDVGRFCTTDSNGDVYLCGGTTSTAGIASLGEQNTNGGGNDAFLVKFNSAGVRQWGTYYGVDGNDQGFLCAADNNGHVYVAGLSASLSGMAFNGHQSTNGGGTWDGFLVKFFGNCQPIEIDYTQSELGVPCHGDETVSIAINTTDGTSPLKFSSDGGAIFQTSNVFEGLGAGSYNLIVKDANECISEQQTASISQPSLLSISAVGSNNTCPQGTIGTINVTASGGTGSYEYSVNNGAAYQSQNPITGLLSATYDVVVRDANGCVSMPQNITITEPTAFNVTFTGQDPLCYGQTNGLLVVMASGGTGSLQYSLNGASYQPSTLFTNLAAGEYDVIVKDAANCESFHSVTIDQPEQISLSVLSEDVECRDGANGSITLTVAGGVADYQYSWVPQVSTTASASDLSAGSYAITVTDDNNCDQTTNVTITEPETIAMPVCLVSVDSASTYNIIIWERPISTEIDSFYVYREVTQGNYQRIGTLPYTADGRFDDYNANPNVTSYRYRISALDTCGVESPLSPFHNTIHLQQLGNGNLLWSHYGIEGQVNPVQFYRVYRDNYNTGDFQPISNTVPGGNNSYTDINFGMYPNASYVVDVAWTLSCDPSRVLTTTRSNRYTSQLPVGLSSANNFDFSLFPNPATSSVTIVLPDHVGPQVIYVLNALGQEVMRANAVGGHNTVAIDGFAKGMYSVRMESSVKRLIVE
jgi:hypothetical protein